MLWEVVMTKTILVTGGAGFIGTHTVKLLISKGYNVIIADRKPCTDDFRNTIYYQMDLADSCVEQVFRSHNIDFVIHLAAQPSVALSVSNPQTDCMDNYYTTVNICSFAKKYGVKKVVFSSTAAEYANPEYLPVDEIHPVKFLSPYAISKNACENFIKISGLDYIIFRYSNVFGPGQDAKGEAGVVAIFYDAMTNKLPIKIYGDGEQFRDFVYVKDVAGANVQAVESTVKNEIINVSTNTKMSINELFNKMKILTGYKQDAQYLPSRAGDIKESVLSNKKLKLLLNYEPKTTVEAGLKEMCSLMNIVQ